ncbi:MAG: lytic transglycosylase domain-containing protein [bacterium]|nr:lytic transglycosylase domain-containing protein [bacterium]
MFLKKFNKTLTLKTTTLALFLAFVFIPLNTGLAEEWSDLNGATPNDPVWGGCKGPGCGGGGNLITLPDGSQICPTGPTPGDGCINAPEIPQEMQDAILAAAQQYGLDPAFLASIQLQECTARDGSFEWCGEDGPFQITPGTWPGIAVDGNGDGVLDRTNPWDAAFSAANYLASLGAASDMTNAAASYNGGSGCCYTCGCGETVDYANEVMSRYEGLRC